MSESIDTWFGLTYSNYLVLQRAILQSMPEDWQERFVGCLSELREAVERAGLEVPAEYRVHVVNRGRYTSDPIPHYRRAPNLLGPQEPVVGPSVWELIRGCSSSPTDSPASSSEAASSPCPEPGCRHPPA